MEPTAQEGDKHSLNLRDSLAALAGRKCVKGARGPPGRKKCVWHVYLLCQKIFIPNSGSNLVVVILWVINVDGNGGS